MYLTGRGTSPDERQALEWFRASRGEAIAQDNLGVMYQGGRGGLVQDDGQAVQWFRKAAEQGYAPGEHDLGNMYLNGSGVPQDDAQAVAWYRKASEQGYPPAQHNLGFSYFNGRGVPQTTGRPWNGIAGPPPMALPPVKTTSGSCIKMAVVDCHRTISKQSSGIAARPSKGLPMRRSISAIYTSTAWVPRDAVLAYMLFSLAAASGNKAAADDRASVVQGLSLKQVERANELAKSGRRARRFLGMAT